MKNKPLYIIPLFLAITAALYLLPGQVRAQQANDPLLYSYQAVQFSEQLYTGDPVSLVMPGTAYGGGYSSYLANPASAALFDDSFGTFGLSFSNVSENTRFLGNNSNLTDNQLGISNIGFIYKLPTVQGSFVIGVGYSQDSFYNRSTSLYGRNAESSMTDFFKIPGSTYEDIAFNSYAIDWWDEEQTFLESIFRIGFEERDWPGITQQAEISRGGYSGEYSAFLATEFVQNLMVGISLGVGNGRSTYNRTFLEIDEFNDYDGDFIDSDDDGSGETDIDTILLTDEFKSDFYSFRARVGALYRLSDQVNIGFSWMLPSKLSVSETYDSRIVSSFDNGDSFEDDILGEFSYKVESPSQVNLGLAVTDLGPFTASFSAEYMDYSKVRLDYEAEQFEEERLENETIAAEYQAVWNIRGGLSLDVSDQITLRGGYGFLPSRFTATDLDRHLLSAGAGFTVTPDIRFELGAQYSMFEETSVLYNYEDHHGAPRTEFAGSDVSNLQVLATLRMRLY